jgi:hypothetical protein
VHSLLMELERAHLSRVYQPDAMEIVRDLQARMEVKKEEEQHEHARRHSQLHSVVEAKIQEAAELLGHLQDIALAFSCTLCFEKLRAGSVSFGAGTHQGYLWVSFGRHLSRVQAPVRISSPALWGIARCRRAGARSD